MPQCRGGGGRGAQESEGLAIGSGEWKEEKVRLGQMSLKREAGRGGKRQGGA